MATEALLNLFVCFTAHNAGNLSHTHITRCCQIRESSGVFFAHALRSCPESLYHFRSRVNQAVCTLSAEHNIVLITRRTVYKKVGRCCGVFSKERFQSYQTTGCSVVHRANP